MVFLFTHAVYKCSSRKLHPKYDLGETDQEQIKYFSIRNYSGSLGSSSE